MKYFIALIFIFSSTCVKADWERVGRANDYISYIETNSIRSQGEFITAWELKNYYESKPSASGNYFRSIKILKFIQCEKYIYGAKSSTAYSGEMGTGNVIYNYTDQVHEIEFDDVTPGTIGESIFNRACGLN